MHPALQEVRKGIVGISADIRTPFGTKKLLYADWTATGRMYKPIEEKMLREFGPYIGNTHTAATATSRLMTELYREARLTIKRHVGAHDTDALLACGSGMTSAVTTLQSLLGLRLTTGREEIPERERPIVFVTHMEHHSNHTTWLETICDVVVIPAGEDDLPSLSALAQLLARYRTRTRMIAAVTAASNVTGAIVDVHAIAELMHEHGGLCFVDYASAAPYLPIDMHPRDTHTSLDAIYFSPHKFLGGTGTPGILVFDTRLYRGGVPQRPGGGTVHWTNPWGGRSYLEDIEVREDGGTPPFWGVIKAALAFELKDQMGQKNIIARERELVDMMLMGLKDIPGVHVLAPQIRHRLATFSLTVEGLHYALVTRLLNDRFGIQTRSGCACAGTYGHHLFKVSQEESRRITAMIDAGDESERPGFVRISLHPTTTDREVGIILDALRQIAAQGISWAKQYAYGKATNEFSHRLDKKPQARIRL